MQTQHSAKTEDVAQRRRQLKEGGSGGCEQGVCWWFGEGSGKAAWREKALGKVAASCEDVALCDEKALRSKSL